MRRHWFIDQAYSSPRKHRRQETLPRPFPVPQRRRAWALCFGEEEASLTVDCARSDGERELSKGNREPVSRINVGNKFVVTAANILDKGMADLTSAKLVRTSDDLSEGIA